MLKLEAYIRLLMRTLNDIDAINSASRRVWSALTSYLCVCIIIWTPLTPIPKLQYMHAQYFNRDFYHKEPPIIASQDQT